jgi:hypothetical protein
MNGLGLRLFLAVNNAMCYTIDVAKKVAAKLKRGCKCGS